MLGSEAVAASGGLLFVNGIADPFAMSVVSDMVMQAIEMDSDPDDIAKDAHMMCDRSRWSEHRAEQMYHQAERLDKDVDHLKDTTESYLKTIEEVTHRMRNQIAIWNRRFKPQLIMSIISTIGIVIIFVLALVLRGKVLRAKLDSLRQFEATAASSSSTQ